MKNLAKSRNPGERLVLDTAYYNWPTSHSPDGIHGYEKTCRHFMSNFFA